MRDTLDESLQYLSCDWPSRIIHDGRAYTCASCFYLALIHPNKAPLLAEPTTGAQAWHICKDTHNDEAMLTAIRKKFENPELAQKLIDFDEDFIPYFCDDLYWGLDEAGNGNGMLCSIIEDVRNELIHQQKINSKDKSYMLRNIWPGHIAPTTYGDDVMWLRIPTTAVRGTISTLIPKDDIVESKNIIKRGKRAGQHYLDIYLTQDSYPIAYYDDNGLVQTSAVTHTMTKVEIMSNFAQSRIADAQLRQVRASRKKKTRTTKNNNPERVAVIRPGKWPHFEYRITPRPDPSLGCQLIMRNADNGNEIDISVPIICDVPPTANEYTIACDPTGIELAVEAAIADGALWPDLQKRGTDQNSFVQFDAYDHYAWLAFNASPDIMVKQQDKTYFEYIQNNTQQIGQSRLDWKKLMPKRKGHGLIQDSIARICQLSQEEDAQKRHHLIEKWISEGIYA